MKTRSYVSPRSRAVPQRREGVAAAQLGALGADPERRQVLPQHGRRAPRRARRTRRCAAPRESASMPSAPVPANRSSTRAPPTSPSIANSASRTRSEVGRVARPRGAFSRRPPSVPRSPAPANGTPRAGAQPRDRRRRACARRSAARARPRAARARAAASCGSAATIVSARARASSSSGASSGRRATRNWRRPDWRVPTSSPSLRSSRSISASRKPSEWATSARSRAAPGRADQEAASPVLAAPDAAAQLVQLGDPEALGVLDQHHGRVRHVDPDLDHRRRDEHLGAPGGERRHRLPASRAGASRRAAAPARSPASSPARSRSSSAVAARSSARPAAPARRPLVGARRLGVLLDQRAHDEAPGGPARARRAAARRRRRARPRRRRGASDRAPAARQLAQRARVEVAVARQRERARDRRRGHVQRVHGARLARRAARARSRWRTPKRCCSSITATASERNDDVGLDQRVRADDQRELAAGELGEGVGAPAGGRRAGQQRRGHRLAAEQPLDRREVLLGERLGRRHQRRLVAVLDRAQHRVQRDHRLAAADLAHQQPLHRPRLGEVRVDRARSPAPGRRSARTAARPRASARSATAARRAPIAPARARRCARRRRNSSWVSSSSSKASRRRPCSRSRAVAREVHRGERAGAVGQALGRARAGREDLDDVAERGALALDEREDLGRGDALGGGVVGDGLARRSAAPRRRPSPSPGWRGRVVGDAEAAAAVRPCRAAAGACRAGSARRATAG